MFGIRKLIIARDTLESWQKSRKTLGKRLSGHLGVILYHLFHTCVRTSCDSCGVQRYGAR